MVAANILICLIHQTNYLLDHLIRKLEKSFVEEGGRERMTQGSVGGEGKTEEPLNSVGGSGDRHSFKSSSRYYCTDIVHFSRAKEKFRWFAPLQSAGFGG